MNWSRRLPRQIGYTKPKPGIIATLHDARTYMLAINSGRERREYSGSRFEQVQSSSQSQA